MSQEKNETRTLNIYQRLLNVMADIGYIQKESKRVNNQYTFVSHDAVSANTRQHFINHGIYVSPTTKSFESEGNRCTAIMEITFVNADSPEDRVSVVMPGHGIDPQDKGPGKAVSYACKYALLKALMLETGDDPERESIDFAPGADEYSDANMLLAIKKGGYDVNEVLKAFGVGTISELDESSRKRVIKTVKG